MQKIYWQNAFMQGGPVFYVDFLFWRGSRGEGGNTSPQYLRYFFLWTLAYYSILSKGLLSPF